MPLGIVLMKWDERVATEILLKYPEDKDFEISDKTLLHLLNLHEFSEKPGTSALTVKRVNLITYYSGVETGHYVILVLSILENPDDFEEVFEEIAQTIIDNLEDEKYKEMIPSLFKTLEEKSPF
jgi:hypothetical protein